MHRNLFSILTDRRLWLGTGMWVVLLMIGINTWVYKNHAQVLADQSAAQQTDVVRNHPFLKVEAVPRFDRSFGDELGKYWKDIPDARQTRFAAITGMSQMITINEEKPGDQLICQWLDDALAPKGVRVFGLAAALMDNEEAIFQMISLCARPETKPTAFIYPLCFDKMRNVELRPGYQQFLRDNPDLLAAYQRTAEEYKSRYPAAAAEILHSIAAIHQTMQQTDGTFETALREKTGTIIPLIGARKDLSTIAYIQLFAMRNVVFHIKATDKRPMIQSRFDVNWEFQEMLVDIAREHGVTPVMYIIPLNPQGENPYVPAEYASFKKRCEEWAPQNNVPFANFENLVPKEDWGIFMGGPDFKHFKGIGHKMTAQAIVDQFGAVITAPPTPASPTTTTQAAQ